MDNTSPQPTEPEVEVVDTITETVVEQVEQEEGAPATFGTAVFGVAVFADEEETG